MKKRKLNTKQENTPDNFINKTMYTFFLKKTREYQEKSRRREKLNLSTEFLKAAIMQSHDQTCKM